MEVALTKRVKLNLFKSRPNRHERLSAVFGFTGSLASVVLLDILNDALDVDRSDLLVVHIDFSAVLPPNGVWTRGDTDAYHSALRGLVENKHGGRWKLDVVKLEDVLGLSADELISLFATYQDDKTTQEDLLAYLVRGALIKYTREKNLHRIITSETASSLSIKAISSCAKGRGFQMAEECSIVDTMNDIDMVFALPMRENIVDREIALYFWKQGLQCAVGPRLIPHAVSETKSINGLTKNFLMSLQRGFDHSMHTVMRSVEKLTTGVHAQRSDHMSSLASSLSSSSSPSSSPTPSSSSTVVASSLEALSSSSSATSHSVSDVHAHRCTLCTRLLSFDDRSNPAQLCYSCDKMLFRGPEALTGKPMTENPVLSKLLSLQRLVVLAPAAARDSSVRQTQTSKVSRKQMREQIQEFLLEDTEDTELGGFMPEE